MRTFKLSEKRANTFKYGIRSRYHPFNAYYIFKCQYYYKLNNYGIRDERIGDYTNKMLYTDYENL